MPVLDDPPTLPVRRIGMVARWKPVHLGHAAVLRALCDAGHRALIGIGSANKYDRDNPFTVSETAEMIRRVLHDRENYTVVRVPDLGHGPRWAAMVVRMFGRLDLYLTANAWVRDLLAPTWRVIHPVHLVRPSERVPLTGTDVRRAMASGEGWRHMVPGTVAAYLDENGLVERFRREFGDQVLAREPHEG